MCRVAGDIQKELSEYKLKLKRAEQEITTLEGNVCISIAHVYASVIVYSTYTAPNKIPLYCKQLKALNCCDVCLQFN